MVLQGMKTFFVCIGIIVVWETVERFVLMKVDVFDGMYMDDSTTKSKEKDIHSTSGVETTTVHTWLRDPALQQDMLPTVKVPANGTAVVDSTFIPSMETQTPNPPTNTNGNTNVDTLTTCWLENVFGPTPATFFNISQHMCRHRGVTNLGDETTFHTLLSRLSQRLPVHIVVFGGSVCNGACLNGTQYSFASQLMRFVTKEYPPNVHGTIGTTEESLHTYTPQQHRLTNLCVDATGTNQAWEIATQHRHTLRNAHLVLVDKGSNDIQDSELRAGTWKQPGHSRGSESVKFWTEALVRELRSYAPDAALIWVETAWRMHNHANCLTIKPFGPCVAPFHVDSAHTHLEVLEYYDVMQISMLRLLGPFGAVEDRKWLDDEYLCDLYHPNRNGHMLIASAIGQVVNNRLEIERERGLIHDGSLFAANATANVIATRLILPEPITLTPNDLLFLGLKPQVYLNLTDPLVVHQTVTQSGDWKYATDIPSKPKTLMIIHTKGNNNTSNFSLPTPKSDKCAVLTLGHPREKMSLLRLKFLFSYQGFGVARIELFETDVYVPSRDTSTTLFLIETVDCQWTSRTSQISPVEFKLPRNNTRQTLVRSNLYLRVCLDDSTSAADQKLKLFSVSLY